jgi:hypothetical protein
MTKRQIQNTLRQAGIPANKAAYSGYILRDYADQFEITYYAFKTALVEARLSDIKAALPEAVRVDNKLVIVKAAA